MNHCADTSLRLHNAHEHGLQQAFVCPMQCSSSGRSEALELKHLIDKGRVVVCSIWTVLRLKERLVKLLMEHSHSHAASAPNAGSQVASLCPEKICHPSAPQFAGTPARYCLGSEAFVNEHETSCSLWTWMQVKQQATMAAGQLVRRYF